MLEPGDTLVVFSDGISEAQSPDGEEYGDDRLIACLEANRGAAPAAMREALLASARTFAAGAMQSDDMTVLIVRGRPSLITADPAGSSASSDWPTRRDPGGASPARRCSARKGRRDIEYVAAGCAVDGL